MNLSVLIKVDNSILYGPDVHSRTYLEYIERVTSRQLSGCNTVHLMALPNPEKADTRKNTRLVSALFINVLVLQNSGVSSVIQLSLFILQKRTLKPGKVKDLSPSLTAGKQQNQNPLCHSKASISALLLNLGYYLIVLNGLKNFSYYRVT